MLPMAMWTCDLENCDKSSVRTYGECIICKRYICATHLDTEYHICPRWEVSKTAVPNPNFEDTDLISLIRTRNYTIRQLNKQNEKESHIF